MPSDQQITAYVAELVVGFGLSPQQRFSLGTALVCQCAEEANADCGPNSPFIGVSMDRDNPFKTASDILLAWTVYAAAKKAELESGADLARDAGAMAEAETPVKAQVQL